MEKRINQKTGDYLKEFKNSIRKYAIEELGINLEKKDTNERKLLEFIFSYDNLSFDKDDFKKRKRVKNVVPLNDRCCALRANKQQCTRRKKDNHNFCGTHIKGTPHGKVDDIGSIEKTTKKQVWAQEIHGIIYYIDDEENVYNHQDIISNKQNPRIIAKYVKDIATGKYSIPDLEKCST